MEIIFIIQTKFIFKKRLYNKWKPLAELKNSVKLREQMSWRELTNHGFLLKFPDNTLTGIQIQRKGN
jgi:hypothetical protein